MRCMKMIFGFKRHLFVSFSLFYAVFLVALSPLSYSASALQLSSVGKSSLGNVDLIMNNGARTFTLYSGGSSNYVGSSVNPGGVINDIVLHFNEPIPGHSIVAVNVNISGNMSSATDFKPNNGIGNDYWALIDSDCASAVLQDNKFTYSCTLWYYTSVPDAQLNMSPSSTNRIFYVDSAFTIGITAGSYYRVTDGEAFVLDTRRNQILDGLEYKLAYGVLPELQAIKEAISGVDSSGIISSIEAGNQQAHDDAQKQLEAQEKANNQQKEQYDQEKQEEADRENQGKSDMDEATGIFNFNLLNPFAGIFGLFKSHSSCVSIPTLASWVHSDVSVVCSWWSPSVVSVLTPVFGLFSMMIVFGFLVSWLGGGSRKSIDIGWDADWYGPHSGEEF